MADVYPKLDRLKAQLLQSGVQQKNQPLYQVINQLIDAVRQGFDVTVSTTGGGGGGGGLINADYLTHENNLATLPNSRQLIVGSGLSMMKTGSKVILSADGGIARDLRDYELEEQPTYLPGQRGEQGIQGPQGPPGFDAFYESIEPFIPYPVPYSRWESYPVEWTTTGTAPSVGNGTIQGRFVQFGTTIHFWARLVIGSTTTFGTGSWTFNIPVASKFPGNLPLGMTSAFDSTTGNFYVGYGVLNTTTTIVPRVYAGAAGGPLALPSSTVPFTWATNDSLNFSGTYETL